MSANAISPIEERLEKLTALMRELEGVLQTLILNDSTIIDALAQLLTSVQRMHAQAEENQNKLVQDLRTWSVGLLDTNRGLIPGNHSPVLTGDSFTRENPEAALLAHLYSFLPDNRAFDVGANTGLISEHLLKAGFEVYAFEPYPPAFESLRKLCANPRFHAFNFAVGATDATMELHIATDVANSGKFNPSLFNTLTPHPMISEVEFTGRIPVTVRSLASLRRAGEIPDSAGILKIDTEGHDLEVVRGMGSASFPVVMTEFWDAAHPFGAEGHGKLETTVGTMRDLGYPWYIVIYHLDEDQRIWFYCNQSDTVPKSWGNALFFQKHDVFSRGLRWCEQVFDPASAG